MLTSAVCLKTIGDPTLEKEMVVWQIPAHIWFPVIPKKLYCNKRMPTALAKAFQNIRDRGLTAELKTWDGCFNIRNKRGGSTHSLHSWGLAIDVNAAWNGLGKPPTMSAAFVKCFTDAGFDWGGTWSRPDGMHFQLAAL